MPSKKVKSKTVVTKKVKATSLSSGNFRMIIAVMLVAIAGVLSVFLSPIQSLLNGQLSSNFYTYEDVLGTVLVERGRYSEEVYKQSITSENMLILSVVFLLLTISFLIYISDFNFRFKNSLKIISIFLVAVFSALILSSVIDVNNKTPLSRTDSRASQDLDKLLLCTDEINYSTSYDQPYDNTGKVFYELKDQGFELEKALKNQEATQVPDSSTICSAYHQIRLKMPAENIVLQPFIMNSESEIMPASYSDFQAESEYFYGFFVKR